jgi:hypothetical protein
VQNAKLVKKVQSMLKDVKRGKQLKGALISHPSTSVRGLVSVLEGLRVTVVGEGEALEGGGSVCSELNWGATTEI